MSLVQTLKLMHYMSNDKNKRNIKVQYNSLQLKTIFRKIGSKATTEKTDFAIICINNIPRFDLINEYIHIDLKLKNIL